MKKRNKTGKNGSNSLVKDSNSGVKRVEQKLDKLRAYTVTKFDEVDKRFEQVDKRFEQVDKRFDQVDKRFDQVDAKFDRVAILILRSEERTGKRFNDLEKVVMDGFQRIEVLYENSKSDFKFVTEGHGGLSDKIENHEKRITKLENLV